MKAVVITTPGDADVLQIQDVDDPQLNDDEVLIKISATALNMADTVQRRGLYPPSKGAPPYPGLECSGVIEAVGKDVQRWKVGDEVCALLGGGGYAEKVAVPSGHVLPVPKGISLQEAAALPEAVCTVWATVFMKSHLSSGESILVHGGSSGFGTIAIQIAKYYGARVFVTAGVDVILDIMGSSYLQRNLNALGLNGRLFIIGAQGGFVTNINLSSMFAKCLTIQGLYCGIVEEGMMATTGSSPNSRVQVLYYPFYGMANSGDVMMENFWRREKKLKLKLQTLRIIFGGERRN